MKDLEKKLQYEIKEGHRVRIHKGDGKKVDQGDKETYLKKHTIVGTAKTLKKQE